MKILIIICCIVTTINLFANGMSPEYKKQNSIISDFLRSSSGGILLANVGAAIVGYVPTINNSDEQIPLPYFPGLFIGASIGSALGSSLFLHLSKNREVSYWKLVKLTLIPSLVSSIPVSLAAAINENDKNIQVAGVTTLASVGVTLIWAVLVYRHFPLRSAQKVSFHFGEPYLKPLGDFRYSLRNNNVVFFKIVELRF